MARKSKSHDAEAETLPEEERRPTGRRGIWSGSISFGLLQIPVTLQAAEERGQEVHFHLLDKRDNARVRYQRVNASTEKAVSWNDIVKGYEIAPDEFVVIEKKDLEKANVKATKTIDIQDFVPADQIDPLYFETPYFVVPDARSTKAYALLHRALKNRGAAAVASFVLRTREHLAALLPVGDGLILEILRFHHELRPANDIDFPSASGKNAATPREVKMAEQLVDGMLTDWDPTKYKDTFYNDVMTIIEEKAKKGTTSAHHEPEEGEAATNVVDLFELLKKSVESRATRKTSKKTSRKTRQAHKPTRKAKKAA